jgi:hypothetical protein
MNDINKNDADLLPELDEVPEIQLDDVSGGGRGPTIGILGTIIQVVRALGYWID